jgi:flagellin
VRSHLVANAEFNAASGRTVTDNGDGSITITYATADGAIGAISFSASASVAITASVETASIIESRRYGEVTASFNVLYGDATDLRPLEMSGELDPTTGSITFYAQSRAQVDHLDFSDNFAAGDVLTIQVGNVSFDYELVAGDSDKDTLVTNLVEAINADEDLSALVTADATRTSGQLALTAVTPGTGFTGRVTTVLEDASEGAVAHQTTVTNRNAGENGVVISQDLTLTVLGLNGDASDLSFRGTAGSIQVTRSFDSLQTLRSGDLSINGTMVNLSLPEDDDLSTVGNRSGSAISKAAAINRLTSVTGVAAVIQPTVLSGTAMSYGAPVSGTVSINGYTSPVITTVRDNVRESRMVVVEAINRMTDQTGVVAIDTGEDLKGVRLESRDGRNIEVFFNSRETDSLFASRTGLAQGLVSGTYALESKAEVPIVLGTSSTGNISRAGLSEGSFTENVTFVNTGTRASVQPMQSQVSKFEISGDPVSGDVFSVTINGRTKEYTASGSSIDDIRTNLIDAINDDPDLQDVVIATNGADLDEVFVTSRVPGTEFTITVSTTSDDGYIDVSSVTENVPLGARKLNTGDLVINGVAIRGSRDSDDTRSVEVSSSSDRASSAIAIAAAINSHAKQTGVSAEIVGANVIGSNTVTGHPGVYPETGTYSLYINGTEVEVYMQEDEHLDTRRERVVEQINLRTHTHGIVATNNGSGVTLTSSDGRNMSVWFDANEPGLSAASFGLDSGNAVAQVTTIGFDTLETGTISAGATATIELNGLTITSNGSAANGSESLAEALQSAIQEVITAGLLTNISVSRVDDVVTVSSTVAGTSFDLKGAKASDADTIMAIATPTPNSIGDNEVVGIRGGNAAAPEARTVYSTIRLFSEDEFTIDTGSNGFSSASNFLDLGFTVGTFGGDSTVAMSPPKVGRLTFQVGAGAGQEITIDLADFSKAGNITGLITGDLDSDVKTAFISTREGAQSVLEDLDVVMDKVNATRAVMGAVMNRLDHAIDNLRNASMNQSASRSQIRDADYAAASTELARTQIMQQAATAVLAQANMSQQTVLQLLQG